MRAAGQTPTICDGDAIGETPEFDLNTDEVTTEQVEQAEAEAFAAEESAANARKRLEALRRSETADDASEAAAASDADGPAHPPVPDASRSSQGWRRWQTPRPATIVTTLSVALTFALLAGSGYLLWQHQQVEREQQRKAEFEAAAGQAVVTLMSINSSTAQDDVQRIVDNSTGQFREDFQQSANEFVEVAKQSQAVTNASVKATTVESMTENSAVVLVTAATTITTSAGADQQPRTWRLSVDVINDGGQIKMAKVDFVP